MTYRVLPTALGALFLACSLTQASELGWPTKVAPAGCLFEWVGVDGYRELATSKGESQFPVILFSRDDWPEGNYIFVPACGADCLQDPGREAMHTLFPLKVGKRVDFVSQGAEVTLEVKRYEPVPPLDRNAYLIETTTSHGEKHESWWDPDLGWIIAYRSGSFYKVVKSFSCSKGVA